VPLGHGAQRHAILLRTGSLIIRARCLPVPVPVPEPGITMPEPGITTPEPRQPSMTSGAAARTMPKPWDTVGRIPSGTTRTRAETGYYPSRATMLVTSSCADSR
jgi:hypothetical protein